MSDMPDGGSANDMSLRKWLAGQALPAIIAANTEVVKCGGTEQSPASMAIACYVVADAMLAEGDKHAT